MVGKALFWGQHRVWGMKHREKFEFRNPSRRTENYGVMPAGRQHETLFCRWHPVCYPLTVAVQIMSPVVSALSEVHWMHARSPGSVT